MLGRLLLVDDDRYVLEGLQLTLRAEPYEILTASSANDGLQILKRHPVDVIVTDERMPGMRGAELLSVVHRDYPQTVRIVLTGHADLDASVRAINDGRIFKFLQKPCRHDELKAAILEAFREARVAVASARMLEVAAEHWHALHHVAPPPSQQRAVAGQQRVLEPNSLVAVSPREREVLELLVEGSRVAQIAQRLFISPHTVRRHVKSLFQKLDAHSQQELVQRFRPATH